MCVSRQLKMRLYKALMLPFTIYRSEAWTLGKEDKRARLIVEMKVLRSVLLVARRQRMRNVDVRNMFNIAQTIEDVILLRC